MKSSKLAALRQSSGIPMSLEMTMGGSKAINNCLHVGKEMMNLPNTNPYLDQIEKVLPRLMALYDRNPISPTIGLGDRYYWAWKLIDFGNATFQGAAHGLSRLVANNQLPEGIDEGFITKSIIQMCLAVRYLQDKNGSVGEAFPHEASFCVTALVAYDLLSTVQTLGSRLSNSEVSQILEVSESLISFLHHSDEHHGLISNHLATAVVALYKFHDLTGEKRHADRGQVFLNRILLHQSAEGWFKEYQGADPGYQSLCTYYLADLHKLRPDLGLHDSLVRSIKFIIHFAHLDGSFGGLYGSRNTRFYYPSGFEMLKYEIPEAGRLADFMRTSIWAKSVVTLETMDEPNLVPMFNSYCIAAEYFSASVSATPELPCLNKNLGNVHFPEAGLFVRGDATAYSIISTKKGGVCYHFPREGGRSGLINAGVIYKSDDGRILTTQAIRETNKVVISEQKIEIQTLFTCMNYSKLTPIKLVILRILNMTLMRNLAISNLIKKCLVWLLISRKKVSAAWNHRSITFVNGFSIQDTSSTMPEGWTKIEIDGEFSTLHMASQGYWQTQDGER